MDENVKQIDFDVSNNEDKEYKVEAIWDSAVYVRELISYLLRFYYLIFWKSYLEKENSWKLYLAAQHLGKIISLFYKNHPDKPIAISKAIDTALPIAKPIIKLLSSSQSKNKTI